MTNDNWLEVAKKVLSVVDVGLCSGKAAAAAAARKEARDKELANYAEEVVQILIEMETPGSKSVDLLTNNNNLDII